MITSIFIIFSIIFLVTIGLFVWLKNPKASENILLALYCLAALFWLVGTFFMFQAQDIGQIISWDRFVYLGVVFIPILMLHFVLVFLKQKNQALIFLGYAISIIFLILSRTDYFVSGVFEYDWGVHTKAQIAHHFFLAYFFAYIFISYYYLIRFLRSTNNALERNKAKYVLFAFIVFVAIASFAYLPAYNVGIYPIPFLAGVFFALVLAYPIVRYQLMDFKIVFKKSLIILILTIILSLLILLIIYFSRTYLDDNFVFITILSALVIVLSFGYIRNLLTKFFHKDEYDFSQDMTELCSQIKNNLSTEDLFNKLSNEINKSLHVEKTEFYFLNQNTEKFAPVNIGGKEYKQKDDLIHYLTEKKEILKIEEIPYLIEEYKKQGKEEDIKVLKSISKRFLLPGFALIFPIFLDNKLIAFGLLGPKKEKTIYSKKDLEYLDQLTQYFALILGNFLFYQQTIQNIPQRKS